VIEANQFIETRSNHYWNQRIQRTETRHNEYVER